MRYRVASVLEPEDLGASGTKVININLLDVISRLSIIFAAENGAAGVADHAAANVTKIELIDGSEVLFSMSGKQAQGVSFYQARRMPYNSLDAIDGHTQTAQFDMNFGRYLWDQSLAFDPKKFRNPQLRITFDEDVSQTDATDNSCRVTAYVFDEVQPSPAGMLRTQEQYSYGITAGTKSYIDLPTDHVLREVYIRCQDPGVWVETDISHYKISEENDKRIPLDTDYTPLALLLMERYGWIGENVMAPGVTAFTKFYTAVTDYAIAKGGVQTESQIVQIKPSAGGEHEYKTDLASGRASLNIEGLLPHAVFPLLNLGSYNYDEWYNVSALKSLQLIITAGSGATAAQTVEILTEQLYRY